MLPLGLWPPRALLLPTHMLSPAQVVADALLHGLLNNIGRLDDVVAAQMAIALTPYRSHLDEASVILGVPDETAGRASAVALTALVAILQGDVNPAFARLPQHRVLRPLQNKRLATDREAVGRPKGRGASRKGKFPFKH